jgi:hypothetical protein
MKPFLTAARLMAQILIRIQIRCSATPCNAAHGPFDHFEIHANSNLKILTRISKWSNGPCAAQQRICFHSNTASSRRTSKCSWNWNGEIGNSLFPDLCNLWSVWSRNRIIQRLLHISNLTKMCFTRDKK